MSFYILQAALEDAQSGRTTLTIAHRLLGKSLKKSSFVPYLMAKCFFFTFPLVRSNKKSVSEDDCRLRSHYLAVLSLLRTITHNFTIQSFIWRCVALIWRFLMAILCFFTFPLVCSNKNRTPKTTVAFDFLAVLSLLRTITHNLTIQSFIGWCVTLKWRFLMAKLCFFLHSL